MDRVRTLLKSALLMIGFTRRAFDQQDALLTERDALALQVQGLLQTIEMLKKQPNAAGCQPNHDQEAAARSPSINSLSFLRNAASEYLPDVSSLNWVELAELDEAVHRQSLLCEYSYHIERSIELSGQIAHHLLKQSNRVGFRIFELGSGHFNPFAVSLRFYLNGYEHIIAGDFSPLFRPYIAARWMYDAALNAIAFPERWIFENEQLLDKAEALIQSRAHSLPLAQLSAGNLDSLEALSEKHFRYIQLQSDRNTIAHESIDFMYSIAVLEHIMDPAAELAWQYNILRPGCGHFLLLGLDDHRFLDSPTEFHPWTFMIDGVYGSDKPIRQDLQINGLRSSQYRKLLEDIGFQIDLWEEEDVYEIPLDLSEKVLPEFQALPPSDLTTFRVRAFVRKPQIQN